MSVLICHFYMKFMHLHVHEVIFCIAGIFHRTEYSQRPTFKAFGGLIFLIVWVNFHELVSNRENCKNQTSPIILQYNAPYWDQKGSCFFFSHLQRVYVCTILAVILDVKLHVNLSSFVFIGNSSLRSQDQSYDSTMYNTLYLNSVCLVAYNSA